MLSPSLFFRTLFVRGLSLWKDSVLGKYLRFLTLGLSLNFRFLQSLDKTIKYTSMYTSALGKNTILCSTGIYSTTFPNKDTKAFKLNFVETTNSISVG